MAVTRKNARASLRLTNAQSRTIVSYSGINPEVKADEVNEFAGALELFRGRHFGFKYLTVTTDLEDEL